MVSLRINGSSKIFFAKGGLHNLSVLLALPQKSIVDEKQKEQRRIRR
jgi:hypothetical protein